MTPARSTNRRLLIAVAGVGLVAAVVGIGASIAGVEDERGETPASSAAPTSAPPGAADPGAEDEPGEAEEEAREAQLEAKAAVPRARAEQIALGQVPGTVDRARIGDETGTPVWEVRVEGADGHVDVLVDATTGAVIEVDD